MTIHSHRSFSLFLERILVPPGSLVIYGATKPAPAPRSCTERISGLILSYTLSSYAPVSSPSSATAVAGQQPSVTIKNGTVRGVDLPQFNQSIFLGIPYAQPPIGDLRLRTPRSVNASFGTLDATSYGPHCWSRFTTGFDDNSGFPNSEDCLTLNVIRPAGIPKNSLVPVVVWIHGGVLTAGGSADFRYNGSFLVEASIANGAPIVFFYQAGSTSVHTQIIAYAGRDDKLFNQAIAESGNGGNYSLPDAAPFQATYDALIANTSCASTANSTEEAQLSCLIALPIDEFRENSVGATRIVFDGDFINVPGTFQAYKVGNFVKVAFFLSIILNTYNK
ncbi:Alpha/Beta hydrolase protein [Mycena galopus ATCC 62051]|nr:Alpha/Beta hydrolase protein [Mycena galopus ATCC 62051]